MTVIEKSDIHLLVNWHDHLLAYWTGRPDARAITGVTQSILTLSQRHAARRCMQVCTLLDGFHLPDAETRSEIVKEGPKYDGKLHGFGVIIPGGGFRAAAMRAFVTTITQLARSEYPVPAMENAALMNEWCRARVPLWPEGLVEVDAELRATHFSDRGR